MAFVVTTYDSEDALKTALNAGGVVTLSSEQALEDYLQSLTTEVVTQIMTKGGVYTVVTDADVSPNTLTGVGTKGAKFTAVIETP